MPEFLSNITPLIVFLGIAALGFLFLLISLVVGDIFDSFGFDTGLDVDGQGFLDSRVISVFVTAFGGFGAIGTVTCAVRPISCDVVTELVACCL